MRRVGTFLIVAALGAVGCVVDRPYEREPEPAVAAPPPPPVDSYTADGSYEATPPPPPAGSEVSDVDTFYDPLASYGTWTVVGGYGRVWVPAVGYGWRPYYYGRWVLTDWGWTFLSDDPWGWAAYHYGRWNFAVGVGWYWIPGTVWAPAWVSWRYGGGYAAWCPLGPSGVIYGYNHPAWVAIPERHFTQPIPRAAIPTGQTAGIVTTARPLGTPGARPVRGTFGPPVANIQRAVGQPVPRVAAANVTRPHATPTPAPMRSGNDAMRSPMQPRARIERTPAPIPHSGAPGAHPYSRAPVAHPYTGAPHSGTPVARPGGGGAHYGAPPPPAAQSAPAPAPAPAPQAHPHAEGSKSK